ncbi:MAG TPA: hypothetical protein VHV57_11100 [Acidimicrobiales bacterium]|nr:hypothetical protein [Acidimicrobiales bacterium]
MAQTTGGIDVAVDREIHFRCPPEGVGASNDGDRLGPETPGVIADGGVEVIDGEGYVQAAHG